MSVCVKCGGERKIRLYIFYALTWFNPLLLDSQMFQFSSIYFVLFYVSFSFCLFLFYTGIRLILRNILFIFT